MSILDEIDAHVNGGRLFMVNPSNEIRAHRIPESERRALYISPEIQKFLESADPSAPDTEADFDEIILGERFDVALRLDHQYCRMARLDEASEEVWEIRIYDTKPQLRFFGRFADRDVFIALIGPIRRIRNTLNWRSIKRQCIADWNKLFTYQPVSNGDDIDVYLSKVDLV
jgi:hypothetical protein